MANYDQNAILTTHHNHDAELVKTNRKEDEIILFDVDGTLTLPRQRITKDMEEFLDNLSSRFVLGLVSGSDIDKIAEQTTSMDIDKNAAIDRCIRKFDYVFAENGLVAFKNGQLLKRMNILQHVGEKNLQRVINFCLRYISELQLPAKRGNFIEFRSGLINVCPVGRSCNQIERDEFTKYDEENHIRESFVRELERKFGPDSEDNLELVFARGGQISIDIFPRGWDKTFCLRYLDSYKKIHFVGDKTTPGGNDYEIYVDARTIGYETKSPQDTKKLLCDFKN